MHKHSHDHSHNHSGLSLAFWMNLIFAIIELIGGLITNSKAIMADALHDFTDALAIGIAVLIEKYSEGKSNKASLISAIIMSSMLIIVSITIGIKAYHSFFDTEIVNSVGMFLLAILGIIINGYAFLRIKKSTVTKSNNSKAISLHLLEDVLGWIAVLLGSIIMYFSNWYWIDGVLSLAIAMFICYNASINLKESIAELIQTKH